MIEQFTMVAPCHFGLEGILAGELRRMGASDVMAENGRVRFSGDASILARANIELRTAERVCIQLASFPATTFDELFEGVRAIPLEDYIGKKDAFPVKGWSLNSKLHSIPDCQSIIKKAAVERLKQVYQTAWFTETDSVHLLRFSILKDQCTIMLDTSGPGLHKRGYRQQSNLAPIKETLAAGIIDLARVKPDTQIADPFCGSGTFLVEAAMKAMQIAPGLRRKFAAQEWGLIPPQVWREERTRALDRIKMDAAFRGFGGDLDPEAVALTKHNAKKAGVLSKLQVTTKNIKEFRSAPNRIVFANPPYGERMMEKRQAETIYETMGKVFRPMEGNRFFIISSHPSFEKHFGRKADKKRKLYNGMLKCYLYQYFS